MAVVAGAENFGRDALAKNSLIEEQGIFDRCSLAVFLQQIVKASTARALSVVSRSTAKNFRARHPSALMRTMTVLNAPGSRARGLFVFGLRPIG